jgi:two-component system, OmpR family, response regulator
MSVIGSSSVRNVRHLRFASMSVVTVRWPTEEVRRQRLCGEGVARLLLVEAGGLLPLVIDPLEDWVRMPADDQEVQCRVATLTARVKARERTTPTLDQDGVLRCDGRWVSLPPVEARLAMTMLDRLGSVVHRDVLTEAGWPGGSPGRNALDVHMLRLRRRVTTLGLVIRTVRARGYVLEQQVSQPPPENRSVTRDTLRSRT